jgi:translation initiation factor 2 beta subunit (eIF-2beta)/eIF-5
MTDLPDILARVRKMREEINETLDRFGGFVRCETCGSTHDLAEGEAGEYMAHGWPECCGMTMRWWTQNQIDNGEVVR